MGEITGPPRPVPLRPWILLLILTFLPRKSCSIAGHGATGWVFWFKRNNGLEMKKIFFWFCLGVGVGCCVAKGNLILYIV